MQHLETEMLNFERREQASKELYFGGIYHMIHYTDNMVEPLDCKDTARKSIFNAKYLGRIVQGTSIMLHFLVDNNQVFIDFDYLHDYSILQVQ